MFSRQSLLWIVLSGLAIGSPAQQTPGTKQPPSKVERLNRAPIDKEILQVRLPHPRELSLPNGLSILFLEQHKLPIVYYSLWIKSGAISDPKDLPGLASFTADQLREGTA